MRQDKFNMYVDALQGHPSIAYTEITANHIRKDISVFPEHKDKKILVIGCADGSEVNALNELGFKATGITLGDNNVQEGKRRFGEDLDIHNMDMHDLDFPNETFDYAYSSHSFEHTFAPWFHVMEVYSVLKKGGIWFLKYPIFKPEIGEPHIINHHHPNLAPFYVHSDIFKSCGFEVSHKVGEEEVEINWILIKPSELRCHSNIADAYARRSKF